MTTMSHFWIRLWLLGGFLFSSVRMSSIFPWSQKFQEKQLVGQQASSFWGRTSWLGGEWGVMGYVISLITRLKSSLSLVDCLSLILKACLVIYDAVPRLRNWRLFLETLSVVGPIWRRVPPRALAQHYSCITLAVDITHATLAQWTFLVHSSTFLVLEWT